MSGSVKQFVDFTGNTNNDTGENNAASIQPIANGEVVDATVSSRPGESLRQRTEAIRDVMADSLYLRDADRGWLVTGPHPTITWPGSTTGGDSGIPVLSNALWVLPMLTPGASGNTPPVASAFGVLHLKRSSDSANSISVTSRRRSYAAGDQINVTVTSGASFSCVLDVEVGLRRTIKIVATASTTLGAVITALNGLTPPAPDNTQLVTAALEGGASSGDFLLAPQARQYVTGNYDGEAHQIGVSTMSGFFSSNPTQALAEGDTLCVRYDMVTDPASTGGRRQSTLENANFNLPTSSLFNSRVHPELLPNAIPVCKVVASDLVFPGGRTIQRGAVNVSLAGNTGADFSYAGGPAWADTTANPATTVEGQLDKIITDLAGASGSAKIQGSAINATDLAAGTVQAQLSSVLTGLLDLDRRNMATSLVLGGIGPGVFASTADEDDPSQGPTWPTPGNANLIYALTPGSARFAPGSTGTKLKITQGVLFQTRFVTPDPLFLTAQFDGTDEFTFANGHATLKRIDLLQMKLDWATAATAGFPNKRVVTKTINIKQGTPASTPTVPNPDVGFAPLCHVFVPATWDGTQPIGRPWYNASPHADVWDQRMPLGVQVHNVKVSIGGFYDPAVWVKVDNGRLLQCNTNTDNINNRLNVSCPIVRGRLIAVAINSAAAGANDVFMGTLEEPSGHGEDYTMTSILTTSGTLTYVKAGIEKIDLGSAGGGFVPSANYGKPLWMNGWQMHDAPFKDHFTQFGGTTVGSSVVNLSFVPHLNFLISEVTFFVATGI